MEHMMALYTLCAKRSMGFGSSSKISHIPENFDDYVDINEDEDSYSDEQYQYYNQEQKIQRVPSLTEKRIQLNIFMRNLYPVCMTQKPQLIALK